jgi:hypothetical protein
MVPGSMPQQGCLDRGKLAALIKGRLMEQINTIALADPAIYPDIALLQEVLGDSFKAYQDALELYESQGFNYEWKYYNDGKAWLCKVQFKKKTIVWMSAFLGYMKATIYFPERYVGALTGLALSPERVELILSAKNVGKSKPCTFDIKDSSVLADFEKTIKYKLSIL